jgi:hypothetical protein
MEKGTSQFFRSAGRCGAMRHGVHAGMPLGCPLPACSWGNNLIFQKTLIFRKSLQICGQGMQPRPWARHASEAKAKAKACSQGQGSPLWACCPGPGHAAAKAKAAPMGRQRRPRPCLRACCQGQGTQPGPWHACVGRLACPWVQAGGHAGMPLGAGSSKAPACPVGEGVACPVGGMPRPWHALGTPTRPWQHLGGLLLPSLDSLFGHLLLLPP